jgi:K+-sensing histidine kinase KdpD
LASAWRSGIVLFDVLVLPPYYRLTLQNPLDWLVLAAFLVTAAVSAHLLDQAQRRADEARERGAEVGRLSALGAEALNAPRADLAVTGVENLIRETPVERAVHTRSPVTPTTRRGVPARWQPANCRRNDLHNAKRRRQMGRDRRPRRVVPCRPCAPDQRSAGLAYKGRVHSAQQRMLTQ